MVRMEIRQFGQEEWYQIISQFEDLSLAQMWEYAEAKAKLGPWKPIRHLFWKGNEIVGVAQGVMRTIPLSKRGLVWICRAPLWRKIEGKENFVLLEEMLKELIKYWVKDKKMYLRIAPPLTDKDKNKDFLENIGFRVCNPNFKWSSAMIDLAEDEEVLYRRLRKRWRQYFRRLKEQNVFCGVYTSFQALNELLLDYQALADEKGIDISSTHPRFVKELQRLLFDNNKMLVFTAIKNQVVLGRLLIARYGNTSVAYVIGKNLLGRKLHINHFLYWEAIKEMKRRGYKWFDVGGADPERTPPGILHFKEGLGGTPYRLVGEFEAYEGGFISWTIKMMIRRYRKAQALK